MSSYTTDAFRLLNVLMAIHEKISLMGKNPMTCPCGHKIFTSQIKAIVLIEHQPGINITQLAQHLNISKPSASELIAKLAENGLIRKSRDAGNAKEVILFTTDRCKEILEEVDRQQERIFQDFQLVLKELHEPNYELVVRVLEKIDQHFQSFIKESH